MCQKEERWSHLNQKKLKRGPSKTRTRGPTSSSSIVGLGFPRVISSKKAIVDGPNAGNEPIHDCARLSKSPNEPKNFFLSSIKKGSIKGRIKTIRSGLFKDST